MNVCKALQDHAPSLRLVRQLPSALCSSIRLLEYVRTSRDATTGRISSGLHGTASATDLEGLYEGPQRSQSRTGTRRTWTTNLLRHRDYGIGRRHSGDSPPATTLGRLPEQGHPPLDPPGAAILRGAGPSSGSGCWRTRKRTTAGGPSGAMGRDPATPCERSLRCRPFTFIEMPTLHVVGLGANQ